MIDTAGLDGKVTIVTGAGAVLGAATAELSAAAGASVLVPNLKKGVLRTSYTVIPRGGVYA